MPSVRTTAAWTDDQVGEIYRQPLIALIERAHAVHRDLHPEGEVQLCHLLSIKTGGCPEDCAYCPQSARYHTGVEAEKLMGEAEVLAAAQRAKEAGSTRFCMGAAWRNVKEGPEFDRVLGMVRGVAGMGLEVCCTLGMLNPGQAEALAAAGLTAYNHNLDTSPEFYGHIISTRTYEDRLRTIETVRNAGISVCCGGILGLGEGENDRIQLLTTLANLNPPPESVPINALVAVEGTPLAEQPPVNAFEFVRAIATARVLMPASKVRLSAGRLSLSPEAQALCFYAGANSIFVGDRLLTTPNPDFDHDHALLETLGLVPEAPQPTAKSAAAPRGSRTTTAGLELAWGEELAELEAQARLRRLSPPAGEDFCSNDYLGLSRHPAIREAVAKAVRDGAALGSTASRLVRGDAPELEAAERRFCGWQGAEAALLYSSGYAAAAGLLTTVLRPQDIVFSDALNHASLIDGMRLAGCRRVRVPHLDPEAWAEVFRRHPATGGQRRFLVVESLFSMDGDLAPLDALVELCRASGVAMVVDEAHATGLFAPARTPERADVIVATLHPCGKALGASGALVAGSARLRQLLINRSRSFIYSTAPSPLLGVQLAAAIQVIQGEPQRREQVFTLARALRAALVAAGFQPGGAELSPIVPVILGEDGATLAAASQLQARGFDVRAIRPPTVPEGTARLRLTVHAGQSVADVHRLCAAFSLPAPIPA